jgi:hypothetical protein
MYYIPPAEHVIYRVGTEILGYDIRAGKILPEENDTRAALPSFTPDWVRDAQEYGLHMTTAGTFEYDPATLSMETLIEACDIIMNCFDPAKPMVLTQHQPDFIWQGGFTGLRYDANLAFQTLHTALCTYLPRYGVNSRPMRRLQDDPNAFDGAPHMAHRTQHFFTPYIFDDFLPHFTLLNPYTGDAPDAIREALIDMVGDVEQVTVESMCLVRLRDDHTHYEIVHEFHRP